jgi:general secretion pathway protein E
MRLDPDVILVGEIRDSDTAHIAIQAALNGHLVLSSIHANDSVGALFRLLGPGSRAIPHFISAYRCCRPENVRRICPYLSKPELLKIRKTLV